MAFSKIILLVRRSQDWFHGMSDHYSLRYLSNRSSRRLHHAMDGWRMFFKLPYVEFRKKLSLLARKTYLPNEFDAIFYWCDWDMISRYPDGTWVVPIDEDDWLSRRFVSVVKQAIGGCSHENLIRWDIREIDTNGGRIRCRGPYPSCSYAGKMPFPQLLLMCHWRFWKRPIDFPYLECGIPDILALKIDSISSMSFMWAGEFSRLIRVAKERIFLDGSVIPEDFRPYVGEYNEILRELYDSCRV